MTRTYNEKIRCQRCGNEQTTETDFERWVRSNPNLDASGSGIVRFDLDMLLHRYKFLIDGKGDRNFQCMMFVEVKCFLAEPTPAQTDTLSALNQIMRNRRVNIHKKPRQQSTGPARIKSKMLNRDVALGLYGGHLLQFDATSPANSKKILWDHNEIDQQTLVELLLFQRDPDCPNRLMDHRRRSQAYTDTKLLF
jgi:hypothetical protein